MRVVRLFAGFAVFVASFVLAGPVAAGDPCFHDMARPPVSEGNATVVKMDACAFFPTIAHVPVGTEVEFLNADQVGHEVVGANLAWGHHDKILERGDQLRVSFTKAGIYPYACMIHPGMSGAIIVGEVANAAAAPGAATANEPEAGRGAPVQPPADPAAASASPDSLGRPVVVLGLAVVTLVVLLGGLLAIRRRRSDAVRPTA